MRLTELTLLLWSATACSTLQERIEEKVHIGDHYTDVKENLGGPHDLTVVPEPSQSVIMEYVDGRDVCRIRLEEDVVTKLDCDHKNAGLIFFAAVLQGAGQGLMHAQDNSYRCDDNGGGHYTCYGHGNTYNCNAFGNTIRCR